MIKKMYRSFLLLLTLTCSPVAASTFEQILAQECSAVPRDVVMKVVTHESKSFYQGRVQPWPWTLNIDGQGYYYASYQLALLAAIKAHRNGASKLGIGFGQIEWKYHKGRFDENIAAALNPRNNIKAVCQILVEAWGSKRVKTWEDAIAYYHRPVLDDIARKYAEKVLAL